MQFSIARLHVNINRTRMWNNVLPFQSDTVVDTGRRDAHVSHMPQTSHGEHACS